MNNLAEIRKTLGISQEEIAKKTGLTQGAWGHFETGRRTPSIKTARKVVKALNDLGGNFTFDDVFPDDEQ